MNKYDQKEGIEDKWMIIVFYANLILSLPECSWWWYILRSGSEGKRKSALDHTSKVFNLWMTFECDQEKRMWMSNAEKLEVKEPVN